MHNLNDMLLFATVANCGSFTAAAEQLNVPKSTLSQRLSRLEDELGVRLLERTTRRLRITEAGELYLNYCKRIQAEAEQAEVAIHSLLETPQGIIRISAPYDIGQGLLMPMLGEFLRQHPKIQLHCEYSNRRVDLLEEGFDLAIRVGKLEDTSLVAKRLGETAPKLFASQSYLAEHGTPKQVKDLEQHDVLVMGDSIKNNCLTLIRSNKSLALTVKPIVTVNDFISLRDLAIQGVGIVLLPPYLCRDADSSLQMILPEWSAPAAAITALYPSHRGATPKVRALLDFLADAVSPLLD